VKVCTTCTRRQPDREFYADPRARDGKQAQCRTCQNAAKKRRYHADPDYRARVNKRNRAAYRPGTRRALAVQQKAERAAIVAEAKAQPCVDCGNSYPPAAMDFDHVRGEKGGTIAHLVCSGGSIERLKEEIAKCEIRCAVCHRLRHHHKAVAA
jgi:hypothetical protein